jgi:chromosome partitioning protein
MVITLAARKGGVGKSTSGIHLGAYLAGKGRTLVIDGDLGRSVARWARRANALPFDVQEEPQADPRGYTNIVIDTKAGPRGGADEARAGLRPAHRADGAGHPQHRGRHRQLDGLADVDRARDRVLLTLVPPPPSHDAEEARASLRKRGIEMFKGEIPRFVAYQRAALAGVVVKVVEDPRADRAWYAYQQIGRELLR